MKTIYTMIIFLFFCNFMLAQGEIIDRETKKVNDYNLKILEVKNDSLTYKAFGRVKKIPLSSVLAYRIDCKKDAFIYPNGKENELYIVKHEKAINKVVALKEEGIYIIKVLRKYQVYNDSFHYNSLPYNIYLCSKESSKIIKANPQKQFYIVMKSDSFQIKCYGHLYKIIDDSMMYFAVKRTDKNENGYAIKINDIKYIGIESRKAHIIRMIAGGFSCLLVPTFGLITIPVHIFNQPTIRQYNIENNWRLTLLENNIKKNSSKS